MAIDLILPSSQSIITHLCKYIGSRLCECWTFMQEYFLKSGCYSAYKRIPYSTLVCGRELREDGYCRKTLKIVKFPLEENEKLDSSAIQYSIALIHRRKYAQT